VTKRAILITLLLPIIASAQWQMDFDELAAVCGIPAASGSSWATITNLTDHWLLNDNAANKTVANTIGSQSATSTVNTSVMSVSGKISGAMQFDSTNRWIAGASSQTLSAIYPITISAWIRWDGNNGRAYAFIVDKQVYRFQQGDDSAILAVKSDGRLYSAYGGNYGSTPTKNINGGGTALTTGQWSHVVSTFDGVTLTTFINASINQQANPSGGTLSYFTQNPWLIGTPNDYDRAGGWNFYGLIDDVRIYNRVLSTNEIARIYNAGSGTENE
jgi:hypothetical protein